MAANEEIQTMQELINLSQKNLNGQRELLTYLLQFNRAREAFIEEPTSAKLATDLVKSAMVVQRKIEKEHLAHLFSTDFLGEVQFYNQLGKQQKP